MWDIFVKDLETGAIERVSVSSSGTQANGTSMDPVISGDGRYVAFASGATNLVSGDTNGQRDMFLHDRDTATTTRISVGTGGAQANGASDEPSIDDAIGSDTYTYDQANRLTGATVGASSESYAYDGDGVRFSRTVGTDPAVRYVSDVNAGLPVTIADGTRKYVWGLGLAYAVDGTAVEVYHPDRLGSVRTLTDASGDVVATYRTDEWGVPTGSTGSSGQPFGFTGEPADATGLSYLRARYYAPQLGRFLSRDVWPAAIVVPCSLNRYSYVENTPTTHTDPSGLVIVNAVGAGVKCGYAAAAVASEVGYAAISGSAVSALAAGGAAVPGANVVLLGVAIFSGALAAINYEHTQQSLEYCLGSRGAPDALSTIEKVPPWIQYPPGGRGPSRGFPPLPVRP